MSDHPLPPSDSKGVNPDGTGPGQPWTVPGNDRQPPSPEGDKSMPPPADRSEMTDNLKRERSKGSTRE